VTAAIVLTGVERHYDTPAGPVRAVDGVDLVIEEGHCVAITGPSGCGKSTLLSLVGALERPSAGTVSVLGTDVSQLSDEGRARWRAATVGFIFQAYDLVPFLTATENVALQAGISGQDTAAFARESLGRLGLTGHQDKVPDQLSGGQKQRVGIARSLIHRPPLVLADEPTGGLDSATSHEVIAVILSSVRSLGATLVVVTHDPTVAERFDDVVELRDGRLAGALDGA
jgi:putative ABC transport system ATP-binding protein